MQRKRFRQQAQRYWEHIPARFRDGATLLVHDEAEPDPEDPEVFLLGACEPAFPELEEVYDGTGGGSPRQSQSLVHLWYGSFVAMAEAAVRFDWEGELEETLLHELTHHWERRAGLYGLDRFDAAQIHNFRRRRGLDVPPYFWQDGEPRGECRWEIDGDLFVEVEGDPPWTVTAPDGGTVTCEPGEKGLAIVPERGLPFDGVPGDLIVARRQPPTFWQRLFRRRR
jgi:hypothetical protein